MTSFSDSLGAREYDTTNEQEGSTIRIHWNADCLFKNKTTRHNTYIVNKNKSSIYINACNSMEEHLQKQLLNLETFEDI